MTLVNAPQTAPNAFYPQLTGLVGRPAETPQNLTQSLGLPSDLVQSLRNSLQAVLEGNNPERAVNNLMADLEKFKTFYHSENGTGTPGAKEWPADKGLPTNFKDFVKTADGTAKEFTEAQEWPADKGTPTNFKDFMKTADGTAKEFTEAQEWPADKGTPTNFKDFAKASDGTVKELPIDDSGSVQNSAPTVSTAAIEVIAQLGKFLSATTTGTDLKAAADELSLALQKLSEKGTPEQARNAMAEALGLSV
ncbi:MULTISPECIES: hypothetical protein [unclassified Pseudomonas]|uniref:hypothetical protein n=1 Tax=unclassified Pseudomonas TaxID=196821 RepID=UPI0015A08EAC|nr:MULTISPECIES: hypothetical protein [unclassified Pseudomonas]NWC94831.1 hypothetical protein [Pseudomonas sp. IPO3779]NWD18180.1 hypothetical protein [Pseudomonas sp. IPO3778]